MIYINGTYFYNIPHRCSKTSVLEFLKILIQNNVELSLKLVSIIYECDLSSAAAKYVNFNS